MSHRIIISSARAQAETATDAHASSLDFDITYAPSHDLTEQQVGNNVSKLLKLAKKMGDIASGQDDA